MRLLEVLGRQGRSHLQTLYKRTVLILGADVNPRLTGGWLVLLLAIAYTAVINNMHAHSLLKIDFLGKRTCLTQRYSPPPPKLNRLDCFAPVRWWVQ